MVGLLDVNVLVALAWPTHVHHDAAHRWLGKNQRHGWATCPATQAGFARVTSSPAFSKNALTPREAFALLGRIIALPGHRFWPDDSSLVASRYLEPERLLGARQVTDAHLLAVALRHGGTLVTLDRGISGIVPRGSRADAVQVVPTS